MLFGHLTRPEWISISNFSYHSTRACFGSTQTALLNLDICTEYFQRLKPDESKHEEASDGALLTIDSHFSDLTPLNIPEGHAFGSWRSRVTRRMWLKDFLPMDVKNIRVMTYGYDSSLVRGERSHARLSDYRRSLIQQLEISRSSAKNRPIIFLGHSLGGILTLRASPMITLSINNEVQTLVESHRNPHHKSILNSTHGIFFFGTPHEGLRTGELEAMVDLESGGEMCSLIIQLKEGSELLENQKEDLIQIWKKFEGKIVSFYETVCHKGD
ncbi:hypothetical protein BDD12DRAFT_800667 [Trichophaea hybrida]|nr:hypothetical protein BDD12DRAFT_800667 [Trichophaea hybrida]